MTDKEKVKELFTELGIPFEELSNEKGTSFLVDNCGDFQNDKIQGDDWVVCSYKFDQAGKFKCIYLAE